MADTKIDWLHEGFNRLEQKVDAGTAQSNALALEIKDVGARVETALSPNRDPCNTCKDFMTEIRTSKMTVSARIWWVSLRLALAALLATSAWFAAIATAGNI